jgi:acyl-coenzyme A thioesterase PaaI-like protein
MRSSCPDILFTSPHDRLPAIPPELRQVLKGLALNREPGWNFPGNFLELSFDEIGERTAALSIEPGPHCLDASGEMTLGALGLLADVGMAASMRTEVGAAMRLATVSMSVQLTGAPRRGRLESTGQFDGFMHGTSGRQGLTRAKIHANGALVATVSGSFMAIDQGTAPLRMRRRGEAGVAPLDPAQLTGEERAVYERARSAAEARGEASFIERFWGLTPAGSEGTAHCDFANGLHVGNRVGHTQGGLTFALAGITGQAALGPEWRLAGVAAWYVSPGTGPQLRAEASIVHAGRLTAVARSRVVNAEGRTVLEATTQHSRAA